MAGGIVAEHADRARVLLRLAQGAQRILIITHTDPDPDAIGSAVGLAEILHSKLGAAITIAHAGMVGRAENRAMVQELSIPLHPYSGIVCDSYDIVALVDSQPGAGNQPLPAGCRLDVVIDHHPRRPETAAVPFAEVREEYAASSTIVTQLMRGARVRPSVQTATALFYGIRTDTLGLSRPSTEEDSSAYLYLLKRIDREALLRIENASVPAGYFRSLDKALHRTTRMGGLVVARLGSTPYPDMPAEVADFLRRLEGAQVIVAIGDYGGEVIVSVRGSNARSSMGLDELVQQVIGKDGAAGGHANMAGGRVPALLLGSPERTTEALVARFAQALGVQHHTPEPLVP